MVPVGKVIRAHGVRGGVKVLPYGESIESRKKGQGLFILTDEGYRPLTLHRIQRQHRCWILTFFEITDRNTAESLIGSELFVPESELPGTEEGEYYYYQLIGLEVISAQGDSLGTLTGIIETGANDVYVISRGDREILIPAIEEVVLEVDLSSGKMIVNLPEGLLEE